MLPSQFVGAPKEEHTAAKLRPESRSFFGIMWGVSKLRGTLLGVPIIRIIVYWGLYWGPLIQGNYHVGVVEIK